MQALSEKQEEMHNIAEDAVLAAAEKSDDADKKLAMMQQSLIQAGAYQLHTALEKTVSGNEIREAKLRRIIAHLQAEKHELTERVAATTVAKDELQNSHARLQASNIHANRQATQMNNGAREAVIDLRAQLENAAQRSAMSDAAAKVAEETIKVCY